MVTRDKTRASRQLAFAGWLPAEDPCEVTTDDEYTPPELADMVDDFLGGIALDTCWDPRCFVKPRVGYTKATVVERCHWCGAAFGACPHLGGLAANWISDADGKLFRNRWVQPPYSSPRLWLERLAELHDGAAPEIVGDSLALIKCDPSTRAWRAAWKADAVLFFSRRIPHVQPGRATRNVAPFPQAMLYFGEFVDGFASFFAELGTIRVKHDAVSLGAQLVDELVERGALRITPEGEIALGLPERDAPRARDHELVKIDGIPAASYPFLPTKSEPKHAPRCGIDARGCTSDCTFEAEWAARNAALRCEKHGEIDCQPCADAITVVDEPVIDMSPIAESPQAWPACTCEGGRYPNLSHYRGCPLGDAMAKAEKESKR